MPSQNEHSHGRPDRPDRPDTPDVPRGPPPQAGDHGRPAGSPAAVPIAEIVDSLFAAFDTNAKDGFISVAEITAVLDPRGTRAGLTGKLAEIVTHVDTSRDGKLSPAEVTAALGSLDTNHDGNIDRGDFGASSDHESAVALIGVIMHLHHDAHHGG